MEQERLIVGAQTGMKRYQLRSFPGCFVSLPDFRTVKKTVAILHFLRDDTQMLSYNRKGYKNIYTVHVSIDTLHIHVYVLHTDLHTY